LGFKGTTVKEIKTMNNDEWLNQYCGACCSIEDLHDISQYVSPVESLMCPYCGQPHYDINEWAFRAHKTHLCLFCGETFEGNTKSVSYPMASEIYLNNKF
jgi:hypothetical protein